MKYIPKNDLNGISSIFITDLPSRKSCSNSRVLAAYYAKHDNEFAHIEVYLKNIFSHINSSESFNRMLPIQEFGLAKVIYHEVGHHIKSIRSHGIKKKIGEAFADVYSNKILLSYVIDNMSLINKCFDNMEKVALDQRLSHEIIKNMRLHWNNEVKTLKAGKNEITH